MVRTKSLLRVALMHVQCADKRTAHAVICWHTQSRTRDTSLTGACCAAKASPTTRWWRPTSGSSTPAPSHPTPATSAGRPARTGGPCRSTRGSTRRSAAIRAPSATSASTAAPGCAGATYIHTTHISLSFALFQPMPDRILAELENQSKFVLQLNQS